MTAESTIEKRIVQRAKGRGWISYKFSSPGRAFVPDRIFIKCGVVVFMEVKATDQKPTPRQLIEIERLQKANCFCNWFDNADDALVFLELCDRYKKPRDGCGVSG